jgi:hypothetical protein
MHRAAALHGDYLEEVFLIFTCEHPAGSYQESGHLVFALQLIQAEALADEQ